MTRVASRHVEDLGDVDWYRLPAWYDVLHAAGTAAEVDGLEAIAMRWCRCTWRGAMRWLEPACGTGRYLHLAAKRGTRVAGFDALGPMIDYAEARFDRAGLDGAFEVATFSDFTIPRRRAHLALCTINSIRHVRSDDEVLTHFERIAASLEPGGVYAVGMNVSAPGVEMPSEDVWTGARGTCRVTQLVQYEPPAAGERTERVYSHLTVETPKREIHADTQYTLRTFSGARWSTLIDDSALRLIGITDEHAEPAGDIDDETWTGERAARYGVWLLTPR